MSSVQVRVDNRLRMQVDGVAAAVEELCRECTYTNPTYQKQKRMGFWSKEPATILSWKLEGQELSLPRGRTDVVRAMLAKHGLEPAWVDNRTKGRWPPCPPEYLNQRARWNHSVQLWEHQSKVADAVIARENCLVRAPTGSGKTTAAIAIVARLHLPTIILVWSSNLMKQWIDRLQKELGWSEDQIGIVGDGVERWRPVTLAMQQTLARSTRKLEQACAMTGVLMCDEVQRFAASTFVTVVDEFPARYRVGFSADETRRDRKEFLIYDSFGQVAAEIDQQDLILKGLVHDVEVRVVPTEFRADWYRMQQQNEEQNPDFNRLLDEMTADEARNQLIAKHMTHETLNKGCQVLVLSHRREHVFKLEGLAAANQIKCGVMLGGQDWAQTFDATAAGIRTGALNLAVGTYQAVGQGLDLPSVERGIATTPIHTNRQFFGQVRGRFCRTSKGKHDAELIYLWDQHVYGLQALVNLSRWNNRVVVWGGTEWVSVKEYMARWNNQPVDAAKRQPMEFKLAKP